jgi:hypothetical protein
MHTVQSPFTSKYLKFPVPPPRCPDGTYKGLIVYPAQARTLWYFSWITAGSTALAAYHSHTPLTLSTLGITTTSLIYWWHPTYSWRRICDMTVVQIGLWLHLYNAFTSDIGLDYYVLMFAAVAFYPVSLYAHAVGDTWGGVLSHMMVHFIANIGNYVLYTHKATQKFEEPVLPSLIVPPQPSRNESHQLQCYYL